MRLVDIQTLYESGQRLYDESEQISPEQVLEHGEYYGSGNEEEILNHEYFTLEKVSMTDDRIRWPSYGHPAYKDTKGEFPPIIVAKTGFLIDGHHRIESAKARGDKFIYAYLGH